MSTLATTWSMSIRLMTASCRRWAISSSRSALASRAFDVDAGQDPIDVEMLQEQVQVELVEERVDVDPRQQLLQVDPRHDRLDVDVCDDRLDVDLVDEPLDVDPVDDRSRSSTLDLMIDWTSILSTMPWTSTSLRDLVDVDRVDDSRGDLVGDGLDDLRRPTDQRVQQSLPPTAAALASCHSPLTPVADGRAVACRGDVPGERIRQAVHEDRPARRTPDGSTAMPTSRRSPLPNAVMFIGQPSRGPSG